MSGADAFLELRRLFVAARDLSPAERTAYLDEVCAGSADLRREVEALLESHDSDAHEPTTPPGPFADGDAPSSVPDRIGRFRIIRLIGQGGMGAVYEAEQESPRRRVALKVLRRGVAGASIIRRFRLESEILARLDHPYIARVYESGTFGAEEPYFAMEYVDGQALTEFVRRSALDTRRRLDLLLRVAEGVQHAHQKGIIHRDLKPSNVLVDDQGWPRILDFGIARATTTDLQTMATQTAAGQPIGTLPYMSPEQVAGDPDSIDTRTDVYALGVVAYELLTEHLPLDVSNTTLPNAMRIIRDVRPSPISSVRRALSSDLNTIIMKALEKDPDRRYPSAAAFAEDIQRFTRSEPILARPPSAAYQLRMFARRHRAVACGAGIGLLALLAALTISLVALSSSRRANAETRVALARAEEAESRASERADEAEAVSGFLQDLIAEADPWDSGTGVTVESAIDRADGVLSERFAGRPSLEATMRLTVGEAYLGLGLFERARDQFERSIELGIAARGAGDAGVAEARLELASALSRLGRFDESVETLEALVDADEEGSIPDGLLLRARFEIAATEVYAGTLDGVERARSLLSEIKAAYGSKNDISLKTMNNFAWILLSAQHPKEAETMFRELLELHRECFGEANARNMVVMNGLSQSLSALGNFEEAESVLRRAYEIGVGGLPEDHPDLVVTIAGLSNVLMMTGREEEGLKMAERAMNTTIDALGRDHPHTMITVGNFADALSRTGHAERAIELQLENLEHRRATLGEDHVDVAASIARVGSAYYRMERYGEAERYFRDAIDRQKRIFGADAPDVVDNTMNLARALHHLGRHEEAIELQIWVVSTERTILSPTHEYVALDLRSLAEMQSAARRYDDAAESLEEAIVVLLTNRSEFDSLVIRSRIELAEALDKAGGSDTAVQRLSDLDAVLSSHADQAPASSHADVLFALAEAQLRADDRFAARNTLERVRLVIAPLDDDARLERLTDLESQARPVGSE